MVYPADVHPTIRGLQRDIAAAPTTVLLLPALDLETCVAETIRRQTTRPLVIRRSAMREEAVIRERFVHYRQLTPRVVTTMQPVLAVAREIIACIADAPNGLPSTVVLSTEL
jgi:shikimate kinase